MGVEIGNTQTGLGRLDGAARGRGWWGPPPWRGCGNLGGACRGLMAVDIGNTQTVLGLFDGEETRGQWRVATEAHRTADELAVVYAALLQMRGLRLGDVDAMIVSSVVPALARSYTDLASKFFDVPYYGVTAGLKTGPTTM